MNQAKWDALPDDLKAAFESVAESWAATAGGMWDYAHEHAIKVSADTQKHQVVQLPEAEAAKLVELIKPIKADYIKYLDGLGLPGQQIVDDCAAMMEKANAATYQPWTPPAK